MYVGGGGHQVKIELATDLIDLCFHDNTFLRGEVEKDRPWVHNTVQLLAPAQLKHILTSLHSKNSSLSQSRDIWSLCLSSVVC